MRHIKILALSFIMSAVAALPAWAVPEVCGDGVDNNANAMADEGCDPNATLGICESPLSCKTTGDVAPKTGYFTYRLPPDINPMVPFGPRLTFTRTYASGYTPPATNYRTAMGAHWQSNWQSWIDKSGTTAIVHLVDGRDVLFTFSNTSGGFDYYTAQAGFHMKWLRQATTSPNHWELKTLTGETYEYDWTSPVGKLVAVWDTLATPNKVTIAYVTSGSTKGQINTVTDASARKRLSFAYTSGQTTTVNYQTGSGSTWTTRVALTFVYSGANPTTVKIAGSTIQTNGYNASNYLTSIQDAGSSHIVDVSYVTAVAGQVANLTTGDGALGFGYSSTNSQCTGQTALFFNLANATTCNTDTDCGGTLKCGGKTGTGSTGKCYRAARCLTVASPSEDTITTVTAITPCTGACAPTAQYSWNTTTLDLKGIKLADNNWTSYQRNTDGMVTMMAEGDTDDDPTNGVGVYTWFLYGNSSFPGRVTDRRSLSNFSGVGACDGGTNVAGCKRTQYTWNSDGLLGTQEEDGWTLAGSSTPVAFAYSTAYGYTAKGQLSSVDGPLSGSTDATNFTYWSGTGDVLKDDYRHETKRERDATAYFVTTTFDGYDVFGNAGTTIDPDGTYTCRTWDANRNFLSQEREAMAGQTNCTTTNAADLTTNYTRDSWLRLTKTTKPLGDCEHRDYDGFGRGVNTKRRDDCVAANAGDTTTRFYDANGLLSKTEVTNAASTVTQRAPLTYLDGTQLSGAQNPVSLYSQTQTYYGDGQRDLLTFENNLGKTEWFWDAENRQTTRIKYLPAEADAWVFTYPLSGGNPSRQYVTVSDPNLQQTTTTYDDLGRRTRVISPEAITQYFTYDAASRLVIIQDDSVIHTFAYDNLDRKLMENYGTESCSGSNPIEVQYTYDAVPSGLSCPGGASCTNLNGRLAYVKQVLMCTATSPFHLDQETFYGYDSAGRQISEEIDDPSPRAVQQNYTWDRNGNLTSIAAPSGASSLYTFGGTGNSDGNLVNKLTRVVGATNTDLVTGVLWEPFGPVTQYDEAATIGASSLRTTLSWNLAYRATAIDSTTISGTSHAMHIAYAEDEKGRYTQKLYSNAASGVASDYLQYDWFDRPVCDATVSGTCPTSGTTLKTNLVRYDSSNNRAGFDHQDSTFGDFVYTQAYYTGSDKIANLGWTGHSTSYGFTSEGMRSSDDDANSSFDRRDYTYDGRNRIRTITGLWARFSHVCLPCWDTYTITYAYDHRDRMVFRSWLDVTTGGESQTFFYWDLNDRLIESKFVPNASAPTNYTIYDFYWLNRRPVALWAVDQSGTTARYFIHADESNRALEMYSWPTTGDATNVWALNPEIFGWDQIANGSSVYQPLRLNGALYDDGTWSPFSDLTTDRMALYFYHATFYDPMTENFLQRVGEWPNESYAVSSHNLTLYGTPEKPPYSDAGCTSCAGNSDCAARVRDLADQGLPPLSVTGAIAQGTGTGDIRHSPNCYGLCLVGCWAAGAMLGADCIRSPAGYGGGVTVCSALIVGSAFICPWFCAGYCKLTTVPTVPN